jgi:hypothetical protein
VHATYCRRGKNLSVRGRYASANYDVPATTRGDHDDL